MTEDLTKFKYSGSVSDGCTAGKHDLGEPKLEVGIDGNTNYIAKCKICNATYTIAAPLDLNDSIVAVNNIEHKNTQPTQPQSEPAPQPQPVPDDNGNEILRKLFG